MTRRGWLRWLLPGAATLVWLGALGATVWALQAQVPLPRLLTIEGVSGWRAEQRYRLGCGFARTPTLAVEDALWTGCVDEDNVVEIVRFDLREGVIRRGWPLPAPFRHELRSLAALPEAGGDGASPRSWLAWEGALALDDGDVALYVSRWQGEEGHAALLRLRAAGGIEVLATVPIPPLGLRGLARVGDGFELITEDCRRLYLRPGVEALQAPLPGCPWTEERGDVSVEWATRTKEGWLFAWSEVVREATDAEFGERVVFLHGPGGGTPQGVGKLRTTLRWPHGEYVERAAGNVLNAYHPATHVLPGGPMSHFTVPPGVTDAERAQWHKLWGPVDVLLSADGMRPRPTWFTMADGGELAVEIAEERWLWLLREPPSDGVWLSGTRESTG